MISGLSGLSGLSGVAKEKQETVPTGPQTEQLVVSIRSSTKLLADLSVPQALDGGWFILTDNLIRW
jgi:hypothetical protein